MIMCHYIVGLMLRLGRVVFLLLGAGLLLAACTTGSPSAPLSPRASNPAASIWDDEGLHRIGRLPSQDLPAGTCGLFLFSKTPEPALVFYENSASAAALMRIDGALMTIPRIAAEGDVEAGYFTRQIFATADGALRLQLSFETEISEQIIGGALVPKGTLRLSGLDGWDQMRPVGGLIACRQADAPAKN
ncbi:hypothetical protein JCM17846_19410 [Iodidimonas nitroreducens]|uniref:Uncharacterized protein n=2 Tax=Iodidimonas nitroreducens TaxID=1236968 RepID=A0A5A7NB46_9PROT|nr:hypothetical protein AQ1_01042 [alpha proteobacterium Q-1]GER04259.1 hypothetical protein JCM17846_19410 [Iodidimonas nitroreducens]